MFKIIMLKKDTHKARILAQIKVNIRSSFYCVDCRNELNQATHSDSSTSSTESVSGSDLPNYFHPRFHLINPIYDDDDGDCDDEEIKIDAVLRPAAAADRLRPLPVLHCPCHRQWRLHFSNRVLYFLCSVSILLYHFHGALKWGLFFFSSGGRASLIRGCPFATSFRGPVTRPLVRFASRLSLSLNSTFFFFCYC